MKRSIAALAQLAVRESGADGYAVFELEHGGGAIVRRQSDGLHITEPKDLHISGVMQQGRIAVASYPLRLEGATAALLAFAFRGAGIPESKTVILDRMAPVIETLLGLPRRTSFLAARITNLETELVDAKIAERTRGLLEANDASLDVVEIVARHVDSVRQGRQLGTLLEGYLQDLEDRLLERKLLGQAKLLLQRRHGMSEEQAYLHLRIRSRTTRKRLKQVALDLIRR